MKEGIVKLDEKGRCVIPKRMRDLLGTRFYAVEVRGTIRLVPIPKNPGVALVGIGEGDGITPGDAGNPAPNE